MTTGIFRFSVVKDTALAPYYKTTVITSMTGPFEGLTTDIVRIEKPWLGFHCSHEPVSAYKSDRHAEREHLHQGVYACRWYLLIPVAQFSLYISWFCILCMTTLLVSATLNHFYIN